LAETADGCALALVGLAGLKARKLRVGIEERAGLGRRGDRASLDSIFICRAYVGLFGDEMRATRATDAEHQRADDERRFERLIDFSIVQKIADAVHEIFRDRSGEENQRAVFWRKRSDIQRDDQAGYFSEKRENL